MTDGRTDRQQPQGVVSQVQGAVVDVDFPEHTDLPDIFDAIRVPMGEGQEDLILEVQNHMGHGRLRTVAMGATDGLARGTQAISTGAPISVPVGQPSLGRLFNVLGRPIDNGGPVNSNTYYPIHRQPPAFEDLTTSPTMFETGIKVFD